MKKAIIVSAQFLVELPEDVDVREAEDFGIDWLGEVVGTVKCLDYRHPKIAGIFVRPVPVLIKDYNADEIFTDENLMQL